MIFPLTFSISWINFFQPLIFGVTKWDREIEGIKDKDIIALTDRSHIKAPFLCLLATLRRKKGTKETKRREKGEGKMISQHIFYYFTGGRVWLSHVFASSPSSTPVIFFYLIHTHTCTRFLVFTHPIFPLQPSLSHFLTCSVVPLI